MRMNSSPSKLTRSHRGARNSQDHHALSVDQFFVKAKVHPRSELVRQPDFQQLVSLPGRLRREGGADDVGRGVVHPPDHEAMTFAVQRGRARECRDVLADLRRIAVVLFELDPLQLASLTQQSFHQTGNVNHFIMGHRPSG